MELVAIFALAFVGVFGLAIAKAVLQGKRNPYGEVSYTGLPAELRQEIERVLPGFSQRLARLRKRGNEARIEGDYAGESVWIEADFDADGILVDFEIDSRKHSRTTGVAKPEELPEAVTREIDRLLGDARAAFQMRRVMKGTSGDGEPVFEIKGATADWKWEIELTASGRLLELEREKRLHRS